MKKYLNPNVEFFACSVMDIITASPLQITTSDVIPDVDEVPDYANFL